MLSLHLADEAATQNLGGVLAQTAPHHGWMALHGDLGAGKTTLVRAFMRELGYAGRVTSPTYTLVEVYELADRRIAHYDLYRLQDAEELEWMGARDDFGADTLALVEWPERGTGILPPADLSTTLKHVADAREAVLQAYSPLGELWLQKAHMLLKKNNISCSFD